MAALQAAFDALATSEKPSADQPIAAAASASASPRTPRASIAASPQGKCEETAAEALNSGDDDRGDGKPDKSAQEAAPPAAAVASGGSSSKAPSAQGVPPFCCAFLRMVRAAQSSIVAEGTVPSPTQRRSNSDARKEPAKGATGTQAATPAADVASGGSHESASSVRANASDATAAPTGLDGVRSRGPNDGGEGRGGGDDRPPAGESSDDDVVVFDVLPDGCVSVGLCILIWFVTRLVSGSRDPDETNSLKEKKTFHAVRPFPWLGPSCADLERAGRSCAAFPLLREERMAR